MVDPVFEVWQTPLYKKEVDFLFGCAQWDFSLKLSDFVDYEPVGSDPTIRKKEVFRLPFLGAQWDSNPRHSEPQSDALTN